MRRLIVLAALLASPLALADDPGALVPLVVQYPKRMRPIRVYLDAGHGAAGNPGNQSATCEDEQDFTFRLATDLAARLESTGHFRVRISRRAGESVDYRRRVDDAKAFRAEAFVSLHSDARGSYYGWSPSEGLTCLRSDGEPGFGVLISREGPDRLVTRRRTIARAIASRLAEAGFSAYDGRSWIAKYDADAVPGVFEDQPEHGRRVFLLRKPRVPSVIVETHHALDPAEVAQWNEPGTSAVFATALAAALVDALRASPPVVATNTP